MAPLLLFLFLFLFLFLTPLLLLSLSAFAQNITVGSSLTATQNSNPWRSPNGDFAFGFQNLQPNTDLFLLSIWLDKIPDRTVVWFERSIGPVPRGSTVRLDAGDGLVLRDPQGRQIYNTDGLLDQVAYAFLNDTGNFALMGSDSSSLWESFRHPSDTILPSQTIEIDETLISRTTPANFSQGRFYATMTSGGNFVLNTKSVPSNSEFDDEYYSSSTSDVNSSNSGYRVVFSERASIFILRRNGLQELLSSRSIPPPADNYYRAILDFDGVLKHYYHPRNFGTNPGWSVAKSWPDNICINIDGDKGSGACGYNSVCRLENQMPVCQCPQGFSLADPNNSYGDCLPNFVQNCIQGEKGDGYELLEISDTDWPKNDYQQIYPSTEADCRSACLNDCLCAVSIYRTNSCWKKKLPLSNGRVDTTLNSKAFLKFRKRDIPFANSEPEHKRRSSSNQKITLIVVSVLLGSSVLLIIAACLVFFRIYNKKFPVQDSPESNLRCLSYKELVRSTDGFKQEVGRGAFGIVYKGVMPRSNTVVAVKKLDRVAQDTEKEFRSEVNAIGQTHHKNLVRLLGFCDEGPHRLLVYEYMSNGTLAGFLFGGPKPTWSQRAQIAFGIARGLAYLHEECSTQIIHCDIKPQNILLDEYYRARISDFGLAKLLMMNQSKTLTDIRGTKGYVAPEWFRNTQINAKVDVYSFGVVLLEIVTCRKSLEPDLEGESRILTDWVWDCVVEGRVDMVVEEDEEGLREIKMVERFVRVGIWCIQEDASLRPTMRRACQMLEGIVEVGPPPCPSLLTSTV